MRTASVVVGSCLSFSTFWGPPTAGIIGCVGVGVVEVPTGWVFIAPVTDLLLGMLDNSAKRSWFKVDYFLDFYKGAAVAPNEKDWVDLIVIRRP